MNKSRKRKISLASAPWTMQEFFAGSGLVAYGLKGMFKPIWANDISEKKAEIYKSNFPSRHFVLGDIKDLRGNDIPFAHLSWASFPCQDLSLAGTMEGINGLRSGLVWEWLRILGEMEQTPSILLIENVAGLLSARSGENYIRLHTALSDIGYRCGAMLIDAIDFLPQSRPRVFVLAVKEDVIIPENLMSNGPNWLHNESAKVLGNKLDNWIWWSAKKPPKSKKQIKDIIDTSLPYDKDNVLRLLSTRHQEILDSFDEIVTTGYRRTRNGEQTLELRFDGVAGCLRTPEGGSSKQFIIVKKDDTAHARFISAREAARLMGVPDSFELTESSNIGYKAMGDAVARPVARFIGKNLLLPLAEVIYD